MIFKACAKINLSLKITGVRDNGYHDLEMVNLPVDLCDTIEISRLPDFSDSHVTMDDPNLSQLKENLGTSALNAMRKAYGFKNEFNIHIHKEIPSGAGLGGGSSDAACIMMALNKILHLGATKEELAKIGLTLGTDVPYFFNPVPAKITGVGEIITPFACPADFRILLVKPRRGISTKVAFENLDIASAEHPDCEKMRTALISGDYGGVIAALGNTLEEISLKLVPEIRQIKEELTDMGFDGVLMSGSGSTVFGITRNEKLVERARNIMRNRRYFVRVTRILDGQGEK